MNIVLQVGKANYKSQTITGLNTRASGITGPQWAPGLGSMLLSS